MDRSWATFWELDGSEQPEAGPSNAQASTARKDEAPSCPNEQRPANKRKRIVHPNHSDLGACAFALLLTSPDHELTDAVVDLGDTCRARRVKCIRDDPVDSTCVECRTRHIDCHNLRNDGRRYPAGRAKKTKPDDSDGPSDALVKSTGAAILSDDSPAGRLRVSEENASVMASLLHSYFDSASFKYPILRWHTLRERFENAGQNLSRLDPMTEILALCCIGFGVLSSDNPLILGPGGPRLIELDRSSNPEPDLSLWSLRRKPFADKVRDHVVDLVERRGLFRIPCFESVAALHLVGEYFIFTGQVAESVPFQSASLAHLRRMMEEDTPDNDIQLPIEWSHSIEDSMRALHEGTSLLIGDDLIADFLEVAGRDAPSFDSLPFLVTSVDMETYGAILGTFWRPFILLNRQMAKSCSIPLRRGRTIKLATWRDTTAASETIFRLAKTARDTVLQLSISTSPDIMLAQAQNFGAAAAQHFSGLLFSHVGSNAVLLKKFKEWRRGREAIREVGGTGSMVDEEDGEVAAVQTRLSELFVDGMLILADLLKRPGMMTVQSLTAHLNILSSTMRVLDDCLLLTLDVPHLEIGGCVNLSLATKIEVAELLIRALRLQAWSFPDVIEPARQGQIQLDMLRAIYGVASPVPTVSSSISSSLGSLGPSPYATPAAAAGGNETSLFDFLATPPLTSGLDASDPLAGFDVFDPTLPLMPFTAAGNPSASAPLPSQPTASTAGTMPTTVDLLSLGPEDWLNALQELDQMASS